MPSSLIVVIICNERLNFLFIATIVLFCLSPFVVLRLKFDETSSIVVLDIRIFFVCFL